MTGSSKSANDGGARTETVRVSAAPTLMPGPGERRPAPRPSGLARADRARRWRALRLSAALALTLLVLLAPCSPAPALAGTPAARMLHFRLQRQLTRAALAAISCPSPGRCLALDSHGRAYRGSGSSWSGPHALSGAAPGAGRVSLSCASTTFCLAEPAGTNVVVSSEDGSWAATTLAAAVDLEAVGCARSGYCAAVDAEGNAFALNHGSWVRTAGDWGAVAAIACVSASFCMSAGPDGISSWDGSAWTTPQGEGAVSAFTGISCAGARACVAVDIAGQALRWDGSRWSAPVQIEPADTSATALGPSPTAVSCPSASFCIVVDDAGSVIELRGGRWSRSSTGRGHAFTAVSCPSTSFCAATDRSGQVLVGQP